MESQHMMVNPNDLMIDLPVDDTHVQELMESLQKNGRMIEPVTVWLSGMRIINGFHRTEAAKRLGWTEIPCLVQDCTEDEFWDARIIAAKPHKEVEPDRMALWMLESWRQTFGEQPIDMKVLNKYLERLGINSRPSDTELRLFMLIDALSKYEFDGEYSRLITVNEQVQLFTPTGRPKSGKHQFAVNVVEKKRDATQTELWFESKSAKWGVPVKVAAKNISKAAWEILGVHFDMADNYFGRAVGDSWRNGKPLARFIAEKKAEEQYPTYTPEWGDAAVKGEASVAEIDAYHQRVSDEHSERERKREEESKRYYERIAKEEEEREAKKKEERAQYLAMIEKLHSGLMYRHDALARAINGFKFGVNDLAIGDIPDAPAMLAEFAQFVVDFSEQQFPGIELAKPNPVSLENARIRAENARLKERVASLERALGSKESAGSMVASAVAWSSTDLGN